MCIKSARRDLQYPLLSIKSVTQGFGGFLLLGDGCCCGCGVGCRVDAGPGFSLLSSNHYAKQNIKTQVPIASVESLSDKR